MHKSKVRSLNLDAWEDDHVKLMEDLGNRVVNQIFESAVDESVVQRAQPNCNRLLRTTYACVLNGVRVRIIYIMCCSLGFGVLSV